MAVRVLVGDALSVLRTLQAESVQCVVTSPPYYSLRAYGTDPQVWGGDPECSHEFAVEAVPAEIGRGNWAQGVNGRGEVQPGGTAAKREPIRTVRERGFCPCGAWRGELGSEPTPALFIEHLLLIFDEVWRVLRPDGLCFVNLGDSYSGSGKGGPAHDGSSIAAGLHSWGTARTKVAGIPAKNLLLMPQRFAIAMQERGWIVRSEIVWAKTSAMPESVRDRPTSAWEPIWMFAKSQRYFYDGDAVRQPYSPTAHATGAGGSFERAEPVKAVPDRHDRGAAVGRGQNATSANLRNVWTLGPSRFADAHFATFPPEIPRRCILAGTSEKGACPACGAGWMRQTEKRYLPAPGGSYGGKTRDADPRESRTGHIGGQALIRSDITLGWAPSCSCDAGPPVAQTILDPFLGSGTTALVADRLGRDAIGIELNTEYAEMARKRIEQDAGTLFGDAVAVEVPQQIDLFGEVAG